MIRRSGLENRCISAANYIEKVRTYASETSTREGRRKTREEKRKKYEWAIFCEFDLWTMSGRISYLPQPTLNLLILVVVEDLSQKNMGKDEGTRIEDHTLDDADACHRCISRRRLISKSRT